MNVKSLVVGNLCSRTAWTGFALVLFGTLYDQWPLVAQIIPAGWEAKGFAIVGLLMIFLRNITSESVEEKAERVADVEPGLDVRAPWWTVLCALLLAGLAAGCAINPVTGERELTETGKAALQEVAALAVERYVQSSDGGAVQVERLRLALDELQTLPDITTVDGLHALMQMRIDQRVSDPFDRQQLTRLNNLIAALLIDTVGRDVLDPEAAVRVRDFLGYLSAVLPAPRAGG